MWNTSTVSYSPRFPPDGVLLSPSLRDQGREVLGSPSAPDQKTPVLGLYQTRSRGPAGGRVVLFGDSNCIDGAHLSKPCYWLLDALLEFTSAGHLPQVWRSAGGAESRAWGRQIKCIISGRVMLTYRILRYAQKCVFMSEIDFQV